MGHDDFSTNEDFAAAVAQAQLAADVASIEGTRVEPLERETDPENLLGDAVIFGDAGVVGEGGLSVAQTLARLAKTDPDMALDMMSNRSYRAGRGLLNGFTRTGNYSGYSLGQRMGESFDDYLDRIYSDEHMAKESKKDRTAIEKTLKRLEKSTEKLESIDKEIEKNLDDLAKSSRRSWPFETIDSRSALEKQLDRAKAQERVIADTRKYDPSGLGPQKVGWAMGYGPWWEKEFGEKPIESLLPETPPGKTDYFNMETGKWEKTLEGQQTLDLDALAESRRRDTDALPDSLIESLGGVTDVFNAETEQWKGEEKWAKEQDIELQRIIGLEKEPAVAPLFTSPISPEGALTGPATQEELNALIGTTQYKDESIFQRLLAETLGLPVDMINAAISSILMAAGAPQHIIENPVGGRAWLMENKGMTIDDLVNAIGDMVSPTTSSGVVVPATVDTEWPTIPSVQDTQATVMDEEYFPGAGMTAEESIERTRVLNTANILNPPHYPGTRPLDLEEDLNKIDQVHQQGLTGNVLDGLSQAMQDILNADPELMAQYMAARNDIMAQLNKTGYKEHEDWYPGSQAAATQAGFWGPMALGWNPKYNEYKDAQRTLMGLEEGEKFWSDDWIQTFGWMTPEQINRVSGYGNQ